MPVTKLTKGMILYRLEDGAPPEQNPYAKPVDLRSFQVVKETPCGAWVIEYWGTPGLSNEEDWWAGMPDKKRFVLEGPGRRFCYPDLSQARQSYLLRKWKHLEYLERSMARAKAGQAEASKPDFVRKLAESLEPKDEPRVEVINIAQGQSIPWTTPNSWG